MRVFFGFRDAQLGFVVFHQPFAEGVAQRRRRVGARGFDVGGVFGQHHEIAEVHNLGARESVEIGIHEGTNDLARAIGAEVHENQRVAILQSGRGFTGGLEHGRFHELVVFATLISGLQSGNGVIGHVVALSLSQQIISQLDAVPAVVAVHGVIAANQ
ncbi:hypothetical protein D3C79_526560 [compost metagenome]